MTGPVRQLGALLALRWQLLRSPFGRLALLGGVALLFCLLAVAGRAADGLDEAAAATVFEVAPAALLAFAALAVVAPLAVGGGQDLLPEDQSVALPVRATTVFLGGLVLAPANLVWVVQLVGMTGLVHVLAGDGPLAPAALTAGAWVLCATVLGQALGWAVAGLRRERRGRRALAGATVVALLAAVLILREGGGAVVERSPAPLAVRSAQAAADGRLTTWAVVTTGLLGAALVLLVAGAAACAWALRLPTDRPARSARTVARRADAPTPLRAAVAVDRASAWRAPALRRAALVLLLLPGSLALLSGLTWSSIAVLPGLVAAGAGLLFGINAFCLDDAGALWLASLPQPSHLAVRAKSLVVAETVLATVVVTVVLASLRSTALPTAAQLTAVLSSGLMCTAVVTAVCLRASVRRPHRAPLTGPRDAVLPPGAMAAQSLCLSLVTGLSASIVAAAALTGRWWAPVLVAAAPAACSVASLRRTERMIGESRTRARVAHSVALG